MGLWDKTKKYVKRYTGVEAYNNITLAESMVEEGKKKYDSQVFSFNKRKEFLETDIKELSGNRLYIQINVLPKAVEYFTKFIEKGKIDIKVVLPESYNIKIEDLESIKQEGTSIGKALLSGAGTGLATASLAYGGTAIFGIASTGTAISTLYGVAASNAILASLGGGALGAGGLGMAGGMALLGGVTVAPVLVFGIFAINKKADEILTDAHSYVSEVDKGIAEINLKIEMMNSMSNRMRELLSAEKNLTQKLNDSIISAEDFLKKQSVIEELIAKQNSESKNIEDILLDIKKEKAEKKSWYHREFSNPLKILFLKVMHKLFKILGIKLIANIANEFLEKRKVFILLSLKIKRLEMKEKKLEFSLETIYGDVKNLNTQKDEVNSNLTKRVAISVILIKYLHQLIQIRPFGDNGEILKNSSEENELLNEIKKIEAEGNT